MPKDPSKDLFWQDGKGNLRMKSLLSIFFHKSLSNATFSLYMSLDGNKINKWKDLANMFTYQYKFNMEMVPDQSSILAIEKKA
jgi:hypothetical protein